MPDAEFARSYARRLNLSPDLAGLIEDEGFQRAIGEAVKRANHTLSVIERIRHFQLVAEPFTIENGLMTPTLKLKRRQICHLHKDLIDGLYESRQRA